MSDGRCSTATSGVYSATESDSSNSTEESRTTTKSDNVQSSREQSLGLPEVERKLGKHANKNVHKNGNHGQRYVSRIPPPKPLRYNFQQSSMNLPHLRTNSDGNQSSRNIQPNSRISQTRKKSASYLSSEDSHILV